MSLKGRDIISIRDLKKDEVELILDSAEKMESYARGEKVLKLMEGKILGTLFFEPSTRTRLSFTAAMQRLGGQVMGFSGTSVTSIAKGENLTDTIRTVERYCDIIVIRHPLEGSARLAAEVSSKPVINAGDGANQHPTQTLLDLYTIKKVKGRIKGLNIALLGDLKYARTMRSLACALAMFDADLTLISPRGLEMTSDILSEIENNYGKKPFQTNDIDAGLRKADVIYICRIQKERFEDKYEAEKMQKAFRITPEVLSQCKDEVAILHPLPKVTEIDPRVDEMKCAKYFDQTFYGVPVRMALLALISGVM
ncbi:MAG: aspartate carbamoyltransferase [Candidatus Aenigmarchaeota archaeon]|nr:aspartate carbamoyltransferase [Candidatus Aenigmarchaeota archaeon]